MLSGSFIRIRANDMNSAGVFDPEDLVDIKAVFKTALLDMRGRPEWKRVIGFDSISVIVAKIILNQASHGLLSNKFVYDLAVSSVGNEFKRLQKGSSHIYFESSSTSR
jgi:hypothetical protein